MVSFLDSLTDFMRSNLCTALGVLGPAVTLGQKLSPINFPPINGPNALSMLLCNEPPDRLPPVPPAFEGGQCPEPYLVGVRAESEFGGVSSGTVLILGPLRGVRVRDNGAGQFVVEVGSNNLAAGFSTCAPIADAGFAWRFFASFATSAGTVQAEITSVTPCGADNCGSIPPVYPEPGDSYEFGDDITYNIDESTEITVPVSAIFAPIFLDFDGSLRIPVTIDVGGVNFNGELEIAPKFELNIKPTNITTGPGGPDDDDPSGGQPQVEVPEDEEEFNPIVGVLVFSQLDGDVNAATGFPSVGGPNFLVPRIGSVQFAIKTGNSIGWTSDLDVKNLECYVPCPAPQGAIAVRVTPAAGFTRTFTPVRGKPLTSF